MEKIENKLENKIEEANPESIIDTPAEAIPVPATDADVSTPTKNEHAESSKPTDGFIQIFREPKRMAIFFITIIISLAFLISGIVLAATENSSSSQSSGTKNNSYASISVDSPQKFYATKSTYKYFKFEPTTTRNYTFYSTSNGDTHGILCDSNLRKIAEDDDSGNGNNFRLTQYCIAGKTYYIGVTTYYNTDLFLTLYVS